MAATTTAQMVPKPVIDRTERVAREPAIPAQIFDFTAHRAVVKRIWIVGGDFAGGVVSGLQILRSYVHNKRSGYSSGIADLFLAEMPAGLE